MHPTNRPRHPQQRADKAFSRLSVGTPFTRLAALGALSARERAKPSCYFFPPLPMLPALGAGLLDFSFFGLRFSLLDFI
jgi:hypothetical protein